MTEEPYRWLEAIQNRREYIEDQLKSASPIVAIHGSPGILLMTLKASTPKLFEIYDHLALACLGHPADMEKVRQAAIDTAHVEGFNRSPQDVSSRRLVNYALAPAMKNGFEQIFAAPIMIRAILAEVGATASDDHAWVLEYDGSFAATDSDQLSKGVLISGTHSPRDRWQSILPTISTEACRSWRELGVSALRILLLARDSSESDPNTIWQSFSGNLSELLSKLANDRLEMVILERDQLASGITFRQFSPDELAAS